MSRDDTDEHRVDDGADRSSDEFDSSDEVLQSATGDEVDQRIVDLLSWILDTETRAKIYVQLLASPGSTSEEIATGTGLYPSTVREALAELHEEGRVTREKRSSDGAGNNPYEYTAIQPSELVGGVVDQVQQELNTIFTLDRVLDREDDPESTFDADVEPVTITVDDTDPLEDDDPIVDGDDEPDLLEDDDPTDAGNADSAVDRDADSAVDGADAGIETEYDDGDSSSDRSDSSIDDSDSDAEN